MARTILSLAAAIGLLCPLAAWAEGDRERGRTLAIDNCSQCHVIGDYNPYGGVNNSPSFYIFSERPEVYRERLSISAARISPGTWMSRPRRSATSWPTSRPLKGRDG
jgi:mono/diheme cytochrome c family protein